MSSLLGVMLDGCGVGGVYDCDSSIIVGEGGGRFAGVMVVVGVVLVVCCCACRRSSRCLIVGVRNLMGKSR